MKFVNKYKDREIQTFSATSVVISAAVTAYARIHITKLKLEIRKMGGKIYYSDTDSIVTNIELPKYLVNPNKLGLLKLEHVLNEGIFISNKLYWLSDVKGKFLIKAKGIISDSLTYGDFLTLLNNIDVKTAVKRHSKISWSLGYVKIMDDKVTINSNSYTKRHKIYNKENEWVDTKPIFINNIEKSLVLYTQNYLVVYKYVYLFASQPRNNRKNIFIVSKHSSINIRTIFVWAFISLVIPISIIAYIIIITD